MEQLEQRVAALEVRLEALELRHPSEVPIPYRSKEELQARIQQLREEREELLIKYNEGHPDIVDIDLWIVILEEQIRRGRRRN